MRESVASLRETGDRLGTASAEISGDARRQHEAVETAVAALEQMGGASREVGETIGRLTYGASRKSSLEHFQAALELNPDSAIGRIEYANGLVMLFGKDKLDEAIALYEEAAASAPADAMERLDVELAKAELEDE